MLLVYTTGGGRFGNQILTYAHLLAFWLEQEGRVSLVNTGFWPYAGLLEEGKNNPLCMHLTSGWTLLGALQGIGYTNRFRESLPTGYANYSKLQGWINVAAQRLPAMQLMNCDGVDNCLESGKIVEQLGKRHICALAGWPIRCWHLLNRRHERVRQLLRPAGRFSLAADRFIAELRGRYTQIVGILIRQDDYKKVLGGRFYFPVERYVQWMQEWMCYCGDQHIGFVVASDEPQDSALLSGLPVHFASGIKGATGHWFESLLELAACDLILSPPSTFSAWASFLGDVPLLPLTSLTQTLRETDIVSNGLLCSPTHPELRLLVQ